MNSGVRLLLVQRCTLPAGWPGLVEGGSGGEKRNRFHLIIEHYNRLAQLPPPFLHPSQRPVINHLSAITRRLRSIVTLKSMQNFSRLLHFYYVYDYVLRWNLHKGEHFTKNYQNEYSLVFYLFDIQR